MGAGGAGAAGANFQANKGLGKHDPTYTDAAVEWQETAEATTTLITHRR